VLVSDESRCFNERDLNAAAYKCGRSVRIVDTPDFAGRFISLLLADKQGMIFFDEMFYFHDTLYLGRDI
jgi:hypothetical protein